MFCEHNMYITFIFKSNAGILDLLSNPMPDSKKLIAPQQYVSNV